MRTKLEIDLDDKLDMCRTKEAAEKRKQDLLEIFVDIASKVPAESHGYGKVGKQAYVWRVWITR